MWIQRSTILRRSITSIIPHRNYSITSHRRSSLITHSSTAYPPLNNKRKIEIKRPTLDDVQRISEGRAAKTRGWGSRQIPHRLNAEERQNFNIAKEKGFLTLKGTGYRRERKGSPLANIYRQLCDAMGGMPCIIIEQSTSSHMDTVVVDISPLRIYDSALADELKSEIENIVSVESHIHVSADIVVLPHAKQGSPFTVLVPMEILAVDDDDNDDIIDHIATSPIWQQPPVLVCLQCERPVAKLVAKNLVEQGKNGYFDRFMSKN